MNKKRVLSIILIIVMLLITIIPTCCYSVDLGLGNLDKYEGENPGSQKLVTKANVIFTAIRNIGIILSVVILIVIGIKYMLGSVEEKANYKETLVPYLIGTALLFTGSLVPQLIYNFMQNF